MKTRERTEQCKKRLVKALKAHLRDDVPQSLEQVFSAKTKVKRATLRPAQEWYRKLGETDRVFLEWFMKYAIDGAFFSLLCVLDRAGTLTPEVEQDVELELYWMNVATGERILLNDDDSIMFYELYNSENVTFMEPPKVNGSSEKNTE